MTAMLTASSCFTSKAALLLRSQACDRNSVSKLGGKCIGDWFWDTIEVPGLCFEPGIPDIVASTVRPFQHRYAVSLGCVEHGRVCRVMPVVAMQKDHVAIHKQSFKP